MVKILLVEDSPTHLEDAKRVLEDRVIKGAIKEFDISSTLDHAVGNLRRKVYDGILSDVFFPEKEGENPIQNGTSVGNYAFSKGIPISLVTSTYHHGKATQEACDWARRHGIELVDSRDERNPESEDQPKRWVDGYLNLVYLIEAKRQGIFTIDLSGIRKDGELPRDCMGGSLESGSQEEEESDRKNIERILVDYPHYSESHLELGLRQIMEKYGPQMAMVFADNWKDAKQTKFLLDVLEKYCDGMNFDSFSG